MPKGTPNDRSKLLNFTAKVYDKKAKAWKPIYELPDATDVVYGGVLLSDNADNNLTASTGVTAATPKSVYANTINKLDKESEAEQTVKGSVIFNKDIRGNANTASQLKTSRQIKVSFNHEGTNTIDFDGSANKELQIQSVPAEFIQGQLSAENLPAVALERMKIVRNEEERFKLTIDQVQEGDIVFQEEPRPSVMYAVVDAGRLNGPDGYREYAAGTAARLGVEDKGSPTKPIYLKDGIPTECSMTVERFGLNKDGLVPGPSNIVEDNFLCSDGTWKLAGQVKSVRGASDRVDQKQVGDVVLSAKNVGALPLAGGTLSGSVLLSQNGVYNLGSSNNKWNTIYANHFDGTASRLYKSIRLDGDVASLAVSLDNNMTLQAINTTIHNDVIGLKHLKSEIGTVACSNIQPTDEHVIIWIEK